MKFTFKRKPDPRLSHYDEVLTGVREANVKLDKVLDNLKKVMAPPCEESPK